MEKLGYALLVRGDDGQIRYDTDTLRRAPPARNRTGDVEFGNDDFGDDDDDNDFGDDDADTDSDASGDEVGRHRRRHHGRHAAPRALRRSARQHYGAHKKDYVEWGKTAVSGSSTLTGAGSTTINIRLQFDFRGLDITFTGSLAGTLVTGIRFGDRLVWDTPDGVDVGVFAVTGFMRNLIKDQTLGRGLDIIITCNLPGAGTVRTTLSGFKPVMSYCAS